MQVQLPKTVYATFSGPIDQTTLPRFFQNFAVAVTGKVEIVHLLFQSGGGGIPDGISLYNFFNSLPLALHLYNTGAVQSIAVVSYLAGRHRFVSAHANFMIHKSHFATGDRGNAAKLGTLAQTLSVEDARIEGILRADTKILEEVWSRHALQDVYLTAQEAVEFGVADEIREFDIPLGSQVFNI
jgi:ATP-dependent Clp protease, protease subunit